MKRGHSDFSRFQYKVTSLSLRQSSKHLQDTLQTKLRSQFIQLHNNQIFKGLENLT